MPYEIEFTDTAVDDIQRLIDSLPTDRRAPALKEIEKECLAFAARPPGTTASGDFPVHFSVDGVRYWWAGTYRISLDRAKLYVTHVFRVPL